MTTLYLLRRKMGEYYSNPLWLGVFDSEEEARVSRREYMTKPDPHANQAYYDVSLDKDVQIQCYNVSGEVKTEVFLVECVEPAMFGQAGSSIRSIWPSRRQAKREVGRLRKEEKEWCQGRDGFGGVENGYHYFKMPLNRLVFPEPNE